MSCSANNETAGAMRYNSRTYSNVLWFFRAISARNFLIKFMRFAMSNVIAIISIQNFYLMILEERFSMIDLTGTIILCSLPLIAAAAILLDDSTMQSVKKK